MQNNSTNHFHTAVIGAGPAGMMAAGYAAKNGANVLLIEQNDIPGKKLLITGKGRCNITNADVDRDRFVEVFGKNGKFLYSSLHRFGVEETLHFFNSRGLQTKTERGNRIFPVSDRAGDVLDILLGFLKETGVTFWKQTPVTGLEKEGNRITGVKLKNKPFRITADRYILCTGGLSYPGTGASGDGFVWAAELGHKVVTPQPALVPVLLKDKWIRQLQGLSLKNTTIRVIQAEKKQCEAFGEALFTHNGMSGPIILDMSKKIGKLLDKPDKGPVQLHIDLKPALESNRLDERIRRDFMTFSNKDFKNSLDKLLPAKLIPVIVQLSGIDPRRKVNLVTREERKKLVRLFKELQVNVKGLTGFEKAVITSGGVSLREVDPRTLKSKLIENLYFAGEILDLDGPTGGYNLQVCWSTGFVAGNET